MASNVNIGALKSYLVIAAVSSMLAACGGSSGDSASSSGTAGTSATASTSSTSSVNAASMVALSSSTYRTAAASQAVVTINRSGASAGSASAAYSTVNGSAVAGSDYTVTQGTVTWADGDSSPKTVVVPVSKTASGKSFAINLINAEGVQFGTPAAATIQVATTATSSSSSSSSSSSGGTTSSSSSSGAASSKSSAFGIAVAGNKFVSTQTGSVVQLLGVSVSGLEQGSTSLANGVENYGNATDAGFKAMASWNMNVVRIPLNEDTWLGIHNCTTDGGSSATLQSNLKQIVANANAAGLYVILDLHWTAPNSFGCPQGQGGMPDADNTVAFWTSVANTFKSNPAVIFEMFNEPFATNSYNNWVEAITGSTPSGQSSTDLGILINGGTFNNGYTYQCNNGCNLTGGQVYTASGGAFQAVGYQSIINAIRATGATNVILMNPMGWAGQIATWLSARPSDPAAQLGVGWHEDGGSTSDAQKVLALGLPIMMTEAYTMADATYTWAMQNKVGFSYWSWVDWGGGILSNAKNGTPNSSGTTLKNSYCTQPSVNSLSSCN